QSPNCRRPPRRRRWRRGRRSSRGSSRWWRCGFGETGQGAEPVASELVTLFILALPVASIAWTVTHEDLFRELRTMCADRSQSCRSLAARKFFYLFTCEYCFSHYVTVHVLAMTRYHLLWPDWRGYVIGRS